MSGWPPTPLTPTSGENSGHANRSPSSLKPLRSQGRWESKACAQPASLGGPDDTGDDVTLSTLQTGRLCLQLPETDTDYLQLVSFLPGEASMQGRVSPRDIGLAKKFTLAFVHFYGKLKFVWPTQ